MGGGGGVPTPPHLALDAIKLRHANGATPLDGNVGRNSPTSEPKESKVANPRSKRLRRGGKDGAGEQGDEWEDWVARWGEG